MNLAPIGHLYCEQKYRYEAPRQGVLSGDSTGVVRLEPGCNYDQALTDLVGFDRIWLIYQFHQNSGWKPKVIPPRSPGSKKISLFATRSPYRPNSLGLSCVELVKIDGLDIWVRGLDLLDGTPIFDIKPYIPYCDSFENSAVGWLEQVDNMVKWNVGSTLIAKEQMNWIYQQTGLDLLRFAQLQLSSEPFNSKRKRVTKYDGLESTYCLAYRTWRIIFHADNKNKRISILNICSGYTEIDLEQGAGDKYNDKDIHRAYTITLKNG